MFGKLSDEEQTEGIIIRSEEVLNVEKGQKIQKIKENNEKVSKNEVVAKVSTQNEQDIMKRIEEVNKKIESALAENQINVNSTQNITINEKIERVLTNINTVNLQSKIDEYDKEIKNALYEKAKVSGELTKEGSKLKSLIKEKENSIFNKDYFIRMKKFLDEEYKHKTIFPPNEAVFKIFDKIAPKDVKVIILGQDPYHGVNQANGMSFSVNKGEKVSTFVWGKDKDEATITYTYDESNDIVTKFKIESPQYARGIKDKEEGNKMIKILEGTKGVKASVIERNGTFIAVIEVDLKICKFSDMKKSDNYIIKGLAETGFLKGDGDEANYTQSKNNIIMNGFEERK